MILPSSTRRAAHYARALLLARIYEVFPLRCAHCGAELRIFAFITDPPSVRGIVSMVEATTT
jgi:hypothetical protein